MRRTLFALLLVACTGGTSDTDPVDTDTDGDTDVVIESDESNRDGDCVVNAECPADQRCESVDYVTQCRDGARGTGVNGVDTCTVGEDCASSLCIEGAGADFYCSDLCDTDDDCGPNLPVCMDVAFVGRICVREGA